MARPSLCVRISRASVRTNRGGRPATAGPSKEQQRAETCSEQGRARAKASPSAYIATAGGNTRTELSEMPAPYIPYTSQHGAYNSGKLRRSVPKLLGRGWEGDWRGFCACRRSGLAWLFSVRECSH